MRNNTWKKFLAITLALMMATSLGLSSGTLRAKAEGGVSVENETVTIEGNVEYAEAFAREDEVTDLTVNGDVVSESNLDLFVSASDNGSVTVKTGDVTIPGDGGVEIFTHGEEATVDVTVGDVTSGGTAIITSNAGGEIDLETGAVSAETAGARIYTSTDYVSEETTAEAFAAAVSGDPYDVRTFEGPEAGEDVYAIKCEVFRPENEPGTEYYHYFYSDGTESYEKRSWKALPGSTEINIGGNVAVVGTEDNRQAIGIDAEVRYSDQTATVVVEGGVSVDNQGENGSAEGIRLFTNYEEETGTATIAVEEDVTVTAEGSVWGVDVNAGDGNAAVLVGDVTVDGRSGQGAYVSVEDGQASLAAGDVSISVDENWGTGMGISVTGAGNATVKTEDITYVNSDETAGGRAVSVSVRDYEEEVFAGGSVTLDAGDISSNVGGLEVQNEEGTADITVGNVDAASIAVSISTREDTTTNFTAGTVHSKEDTGVSVYTNGGENTVQTGAITAEDNGFYVNVNDESHSESMTAEDFAAIDTSTIKDSWTSTFSTPPSVGPGSRYQTKMEVLKAENGTTYYHYFYNDGSETYSKNWYEPTTGFVTAEVNGDIIVNGTDVNAWDYGVSATVNSDKQAAAVKVDGNITVESKGTQDSAEGIHAYISDQKSGSVSVTAGGDVSVSAENNAYGITVWAEDGTAAASAGAVTVSGRYGTGARANTEDGTAILTAEDIHVYVEDWGNGLDVDVNGTGSVTAETGDISFANTGDYNSGTAVSVYVNSDENAESEKTGSATVTTGNIASDSNGVSISNYFGNADVTVGNVDTVDNAVNVWAFGDSTTTLTAGEVTSDHGTAVEVSTRADDADAIVKTGDITFGINPEDHWNSGLYVSAEGAGTATVTAGDVTGTVTEGGTAVRESVSDGGTATVTTGDVTLKVKEDPEEENYYYNAAVDVEAGTYYDENGEPITSSATANLTAGNVTSDGSGVDINNTASEVNVTVGNIKAQDQGAYVNVSKEGITSFTAGNITSENSSGVSAYNNGGTLNVQTGSVSGKNGISAYANRASDWQWMDEEHFEALGLEEPTYIGSWVDDEGIVHSEETWVVDNVEYRRVTTVYSEEEEWTDYEKITYTDVEGTTDVVVKGDVSASNTDWANGANLYVSSGKQEGAMAIDGAVTAVSAESGAQAASVGGDNGGEAALLIDGNVSATGKDWTNGVGVSAGSGSTAEAVVHGDISATSTDGFGVGVQLSASDESTVNATVEGDINATGETSDGVETFNNGGTLSLTVVGDITSNDTGIEMNSGNWENEYLEGKIEVDESELTYYSIDKDGNYTWKEYIHKDGDKEIHYDEYGNQWILKTPETEKESVSNIDVIGDVTGTDEAVLINLNGEKAKINMIVDGTLSGEENGVVLKAQTVAENVSLTVWEIKPNEDGAVAARQTNIWTEDAEGKWTTSTVEDEEFEKQIQYIIRVEQPNKGSVDTVGTTDYEGYNVAKEGQTVTLKVNVPAGYRLKNAYNGTDTKVQLAKDGNGDYYLIIPRGGAVTLSVTLERIPPKQKTDEEITEAVEEAIAQTEPEEAANTKVEVQTDDDGKKTVVLTPTETATETAVAVSNALIAEIVKANVENIAIAGKSEKAQVALQSAAIEKIMKENDSAHLIVDIEEDTKQTEEAIEKVPTGLKVLEGAVHIQVKLVDKDGNSTTLGTNENIKVNLKLEFIEGLQIVFVGNDGVAVTVEPVWVEATDTVPGHWEVPYMGVGSYIPVVPET